MRLLHTEYKPDSSNILMSQLCGYGSHVLARSVMIGSIQTQVACNPSFSVEWLPLEKGKKVLQMSVIKCLMCICVNLYSHLLFFLYR